MRLTVQKNKESFIWWALKLDELSLESSLSVETAIPQPMALSVQLPLELEPVR